ncbi:MAG: type II toxin-antitoxin system RelE/ParE family toxin [Candidatus Acidiferrales bacterium]
MTAGWRLGGDVSVIEDDGDGKIYATIGMMVEIREYRERDGGNPFREWTDALDFAPAQKVARALYRMGQGNFSNIKGVGGGVLECRIHFGPGYRVYFGKDGDEIVILLGGGTKQRQQNDIARALGRWEDYKLRKKQRKEED